MDTLKTCSTLLERKKFRDDLLKTMQYVCKFVVRQFPDAAIKPSLKLFAEHAAFSRRLYRWGAFIGHFHTVLLLLSKSLGNDIRYFVIMVLTFASNTADALCYLDIIRFRDKTRNEYYAALFYFCGLSISLTGHLQKLACGVPEQENKAKQEEENRILLKKSIIGIVRDLANMMTTINTALGLQIDKRYTAVCGAVAGGVGVLQTSGLI
eukprot:TRINITY_DN15850_c0_g1_i1.p1 TRINITY_DN15850_c0_g1~~TRINITY_DN15850_c0_g1_i1.p1  ORF type:complete len:226 (+),score=32.81 TRINITY_DN15850_c0_g1_i1:53-679(+)